MTMMDNDNRHEWGQVQQGQQRREQQGQRGQ